MAMLLIPLFHHGGSRAGSEPVSNPSSLYDRQGFGSRPGKLVSEWHKLFPGLEPRTAHVRGWGQDYPDQQGQLDLCDCNLTQERKRDHGSGVMMWLKAVERKLVLRRFTR